MCPQACSAGTLPTLAQLISEINKLQYEHQSDVSLNQANPVQNTWYTLLPTELNSKIYLVDMLVTAANETLEVEYLIDGNTLSGSFNAVAGTSYGIRLGYDLFSTNLNAVVGIINPAHSGPLESRSIRIRVRKTTNAGNGNLTGYVVYAHRL